MLVVKILLISVLIYLVLFVVIPLIYLFTEFGKLFYHDILGWHMPDRSVDKTFDGCSVHSKCKYCGKDIMQDSQGNWF